MSSLMKVLQDCLPIDEPACSPVKMSRDELSIGKYAKRVAEAIYMIMAGTSTLALMLLCGRTLPPLT